MPDAAFARLVENKDAGTGRLCVRFACAVERFHTRETRRAVRPKNA